MLTCDGQIPVGPTVGEGEGGLLRGPVAGLNHGGDHVGDHLVERAHLAVRGDGERRDGLTVGTCD